MAPPPYTRPGFEAFSYISTVSRWTGQRHRRWVWPMRLQERLKAIPIPVKVGDPDAALDLQVMLNLAYERAGYELRIDYSKEPIPPLSVELAEWGRQIAGAGR